MRKVFNLLLGWIKNRIDYIYPPHVNPAKPGGLSPTQFNGKPSLTEMFTPLRDFEAVDLYIDVIYLTFKGEAIKAVILKLLYINYYVPKPLGCVVMSF